MTKVKTQATDRLVERQVRNWELTQRHRSAAVRPRPTQVEDFVCLARMVGLEDVPVATHLGERLGWPVFDREILETMAGDDDIRKRIYEYLDERDLSWGEDVLRILVQPHLVRNDYFHRLCRTVLSLARKGHGVFVGRGADCILPSDEGFRVWLVASRETRLERFAARRRLGLEDAKSELDRTERERDEFLRHHFQVGANDPTRHDVVVNIDRIGVERVAEVILEARRVCQPAERRNRPAVPASRG